MQGGSLARHLAIPASSARGGRVWPDTRPVASAETPSLPRQSRQHAVPARSCALHGLEGDSWRWRWRLGGAAGPFEPALGDQGDQGEIRGLGFGEMSTSSVARADRRAVSRGLESIHPRGAREERAYRRALATFSLETTGGVTPCRFQARVVHGRISGSPRPFEQFTVGGTTSVMATAPCSVSATACPMFPTGVAMGNALLHGGRRFQRGPGVCSMKPPPPRPQSARSATWHRAAAFDVPFAFPPVPVAFAPGVRSRPRRRLHLRSCPSGGRFVAFLEMTIQP